MISRERLGLSAVVRLGPILLNPRLLQRVVSLAALFSGLALLIHILIDISLWLGLAVSLALLGGIAALAFSRMVPAQRRDVGQLVGLGAIGGGLATACYDLTRYLIASVDPSAYNPFEAIRMFGVALAGNVLSGPSIFLVGGAFHLLNGTLFGVAFRLFLGRGARSLRRSVVVGIGWGLCLELFQLGLYPGWLRIQFYDEFLRTSVAGHFVFGAVLGLFATWTARETHTVGRRVLSE